MGTAQTSRHENESTSARSVFHSLTGHPSSHVFRLEKWERSGSWVLIAYLLQMKFEGWLYLQTRFALNLWWQLARREGIWSNSLWSRKPGKGRFCIELIVNISFLSRTGVATRIEAESQEKGDSQTDIHCPVRLADKPCLKVLLVDLSWKKNTVR